MTGAHKQPGLVNSQSCCNSRTKKARKGERPEALTSTGRSFELFRVIWSFQPAEHLQFAIASEVSVPQLPIPVNKSSYPSPDHAIACSPAPAGFCWHIKLAAASALRPAAHASILSHRTGAATYNYKSLPQRRDDRCTELYLLAPSLDHSIFTNSQPPQIS